VLLQDSPHDIPRHFVIALQVNEDMQIFLLLPASLHKLPYQENRLHSRSFFVSSRWYSSSYIRPLASLTARFAVFFATLYRSTLSVLLSRCIRLKNSFFSLIAFYTFSFHHHVSLASRLTPLVTHSFSEATFLMQVAIFIHMLFASPPLCQGPSLRTLSMNVLAASSLSFYYFVNSALMRLLR
jgi:hypothetical protein